MLHSTQLILLCVVKQSSDYVTFVGECYEMDVILVIVVIFTMKPVGVLVTEVIVSLLQSCIIKRYCEKRFVPKYLATIGIDYGVTK